MPDVREWGRVLAHPFFPRWAGAGTAGLRVSLSRQFTPQAQPCTESGTGPEEQEEQRAKLVAIIPGSTTPGAVSAGSHVFEPHCVPACPQLWGSGGHGEGLPSLIGVVAGKAMRDIFLEEVQTIRVPGREDRSGVAVVSHAEGLEAHVVTGRPGAMGSCGNSP